MLVVHAHEESHPVAVPENVALDKLIVVSAVAHRSAFGTATLSFLLVSNSKSNSGPEEAIESLKMRNMIIHYMLHFKLENKT
jgi:hypothetical protein